MARPTSAAQPARQFAPIMPEDVALLVDGGAPMLAPDGGLLYSIGFFRDGRRVTHLMHVPPGSPGEVVYEGPCEGPDLAPDGHTVAFVGEIQGERGLVVLDLRTRVPRLLAVFGGAPRCPVFSPDGTKILVEVLSASTLGPDDPRAVTRLRYDLNGLGDLDGRICNVYVVDVTTGVATALGGPE
jgi:dipeptidyl aminopeptidase/acylaminoacyl peptidase